MSEIAWIMCAVGSALCYSLGNTVTSEYIYDDIWSGKFIQSMILGLSAFIARLYLAYTQQDDLEPSQFQNSSEYIEVGYKDDHDDDQFEKVKEDKVYRETRATKLSLLCGVLNFVATVCLLYAFKQAILLNTNLVIPTTILSGCIVWGLYGSYCVYDEVLTAIQLTGSIIIILGNTSLIFFSQQATTQDFSASTGSTYMISFFSFLSMCLFGVRVVVSKSCTKELGTFRYIELNFYVEFVLGLLIVLVSVCGAFELTFELNRTLMLVGASILMVFAEYLLFKGILMGIVGVVVAVVASNFVLVAVYGAILGKQALNGLQTTAIVVCVCGVLTVSIGDRILQKIQGKALHN